MESSIQVELDLDVALVLVALGSFQRSKLVLD
jgi:hypothetical protein